MSRRPYFCAYAQNEEGPTKSMMYSTVQTPARKIKIKDPILNFTYPGDMHS